MRALLTGLLMAAVVTATPLDVALAKARAGLPPPICFYPTHPCGLTCCMATLAPKPIKKKP